VLVVTAIVYAWFGFGSAWNLLGSGRIEVLSGVLYQWPYDQRVVFVATLLISTIVVLQSIMCLLERSALSARLVAVAVSAHAAYGLSELPSTHKSVEASGLTFSQVPLEYAIPLVVALLAVANWVWVSRANA
jgi:hypothetical protein